jgi:hypothetical protein
MEATGSSTMLVHEYGMCMPVYAGLLCDKLAVHMEMIKETPCNTTSNLHNFTLNLAVSL